MAQNTQHLFDITVASFHLSQAGLTPLGRPTFAEWLTCGYFIRTACQSVQFWIGDWLLFGEQTYGNTDYERAVAETGLDYQTLRIYKHVAKAVPLSLRRNRLSFHHHKEVASLSPQVQTQLLNKAETHNWPLIKLKQEKERLLLQSVRPASPSSLSELLLLGEAHELLKSVPDSSVDMVLTAAFSETADISNLAKALPLLEQKLKINSHLYFFTDWRFYPPLMAAVSEYFSIKNLLVWRRNAPPVQQTPYRHVYGFILFAVKGRLYLNDRRDASLLPYTPLDGPTLLDPTDKPLALLEYLIEKSTQPSGVVCDPFMGKGASCRAAKNTDRRYIGIEHNQRCFDEARASLAA